MTPEKRIELLIEENERLREEVAQLKEILLGSRVEWPPEWGLTTHEERLMSALAMRELLTKDSAMTLIYGGRIDDEPDMKIIDVFVCKVRKKLRKLFPDEGEIISTHWGRGWALNKEWRARWKP